MASKQIYDTLNRAWKSTCKVLLGEEIGEMGEFEGWLNLNAEGLTVRKSVSDREIYSAVPHYCKKAKFVSFDEIDYARKFEPLSINEIKDIDSIVEALQGHFAYTGNVILGNSKDVEESSDIQNSFHVLGSSFVYDSEYVAHCSYMRNCKYAFGSVQDVESSFGIRSINPYKNSRCLEAWSCFVCSDIYFSAGIENSRNVMFSFNAKNRQNIIGNIALEKEKFAELKAKLLAEIAAELRAKKAMTPLVDMFKGDKRRPKLGKIETVERSDEGDKAPIEKAFRDTTRIVLGKELQDMDSYGGWMMRYVPDVETVKSSATGRTSHLGLVNPYKFFPQDRLAKDGEARKLGEDLKMGEKDIGSLKSVLDSLWKIAFFSSEATVGEIRNIVGGIPMVNTSSNCYRSALVSVDEYCAFSYWPRNSKYIFGSDEAFFSSFCIRSFHSERLSRTFEVDGCRDCADVYYSHNCENVQDSMFCFNVKNLRNAIGNGVLPLEKYKAVKKSLLEQIVAELEKKKTLKWDIYNIGCAK